MARANSYKTEIQKIRAEIEALKAAKNPPRWVEVTVEVGEDKSAEIAAIEAQGHNVLIQQIVRPAPIVMDADEPLPPELKLIADEAAERRKRDADEFESRQVTTPQPEERPSSEIIGLTAG
jgi:hypothetical protein